MVFLEMISLIASQTVGSLNSGEREKRKPLDDDGGVDSDTEIFSLLPSNRKLGLTKKQQAVSNDMALKCRVFVAFLVMTTLVGFVMLVTLAAFGQLKDGIKLNDFHPVQQIHLVKHDQGGETEVSIQTMRDYRLPRSVVPKKYELKLHVNLKKALCSGLVSIETICQKETDKIVLHSVMHDVIEAKVTAPRSRESTGNEVNVTKIAKDPANDFLILHLSGKLSQRAAYVLQIQFKYSINDKANGFHLAAVGSGKSRPLAITNFEPIYARRMFPCFDEPDMRAMFRMIVTHSDKLKVTTLMPFARSIRVKHDILEHHFSETPSIPTYLLWVMVGNLKEEKSLIKNTGVTVRKFSPKTHKGSMKLTSTVIKTGMKILGEYLNVDYPTSELDIAFLPESEKGSGLGFMVLPNPDVSSLDKFQHMKVASQRLAKVWLDGLVPVYWWTDHWLMSGLSIFIAHKEILKKLKPKVKLNHVFYLTYTQPALKRDQDKMDALTLSKKTESNRDVIESLGSCHGNKAASLINMLTLILGRQTLKKGVQDFVKKKEPNGSSVKRFLASLSKYSKWILSKNTFSNWVNTPGYPVVHLNYSSKKRRVYVTQASSLANKTSDKSFFWRFPLRFKLSSRKGAKRVDLKKGKVTFRMSRKFKWLKANYGQEGFYRVKYSDGLWRGLTKALSKSHTVFPEIDRAGLIDDAMSLARTGQLSYKSALEITPYLKKEQSFIVWKVTVQHLNHLLALFHGHQHSFCVKRYIFGLIRHIVDSIGWSNNGNLIRRDLRPEILGLSAMLGDKETLKTSKKMFFAMVSSEKSHNLPWPLKRMIFKAAVRHGGEREWNTVMKLYKSSQKNKKLALAAASASKSASKIEDFVDHILNSERPLANVLTLLKELSFNPDMNRLAWKLVTGHWSLFMKSQEEKEEFIKIVRNLITATNSREQLIEAKEFIDAQVDANSVLLKALEFRIDETTSEGYQRVDIIKSIQKITGKSC